MTIQSNDIVNNNFNNKLVNNSEKGVVRNYNHCFWAPLNVSRLTHENNII